LYFFDIGKIIIQLIRLGSSLKVNEMREEYHRDSNKVEVKVEVEVEAEAEAEAESIYLITLTVIADEVK
jgi:hypothetical protein